MKNKLLFISGKILSLLTVIETVIFGIINFENILYNYQWGFIISTKPSKSLHAKYQYWLEDIYGKEEGFEAYWKIVDFTIWIIKHHINEMFLVATILMMLGIMWINKKLNKKMNIVLKVYFIISILVMYWTITELGPFYIDSIYDS